MVKFFPQPVNPDPINGGGTESGGEGSGKKKEPKPVMAPEPPVPISRLGGVPIFSPPINRPPIGVRIGIAIVIVIAIIATDGVATLVLTLA